MEKFDAMLDTDYLDKESGQGSRKDYEDYLAAVPDAPPDRPEDEIQ